MFRHRAAAVIAVVGLLLPAAPAQAAGLRSALALTAPSSGPYGATITLTGRLWRYGTAYGIVRAPVLLQRAPHGSGRWATLKSTTTGANGNYSFAVTQVGAFDYRAYYAGSTTYTPAISPVRYPATAYKVLLDSIATTDSFTGAMRITGRVLPAPPSGTVVQLQRWDGRAWYTIEGGRTGGEKVTVTVNRPASTTSYRLLAPGHQPYVAGASAARSFANYVWRGAFARPLVSVDPAGYAVLPEPSANPRRDRVDIVAGNGRPTTAGINTSGCKQISTVTQSFSWEFRPIHLRLHTTTRVLAEVDLVPERTSESLSAAVRPGESVVMFRHDNPDSVVAVASRVELLCAN